MNNNKVFVGGLAYELTVDELRSYFAQAGSVISTTIITDRETGKSKGFGFIEMSTPQEAQQAIKTLDNTNLAGRTINVKEARPQENRTNSFSNFRNGGDRDRRDRNPRREKRFNRR